MKHAKIIMWSFFIFFAFGCATPPYQPPKVNQAEVLAKQARQTALRKETYRKYVQDYKAHIMRLYSLAYPLQIVAVQLSRPQQLRTQFGFYYHAPDSWKKNIEPYMREVLNEEFGISEKGFALSVWHVLKNSPADRAGMRPGDRIVSVQDKSFKSSQDFNKKLDAARREFGIVRFNIERDTTRLTLIIYPATISKFDINYIEHTEIHAFADGKAINVTKGMMNFAKTDRDLQFVIAHELAHNIERHTDKIKENTMWGSAFGGILDGIITAYTGVQSYTFGQLGANAGTFTYRKDFEREADYLAMYMLAGAGIPTHGVADFFRKISEISDGGYSRTHPTNAERIVSLIAIDQEIKKKKAEGLPIQPNK